MTTPVSREEFDALKAEVAALRERMPLTPEQRRTAIEAEAERRFGNLPLDSQEWIVPGKEVYSLPGLTGMTDVDEHSYYAAVYNQLHKDDPS